MGVARPARLVRFGSFELDLRAEELYRNGIRVRIPGQSIQVLAILLDKAGEVVTREELHQRLWPNGTIVEFDHGINAVMNRLRQALGDSADEPRFIATLPRRGYRFLVSVERVASEGTARLDPEPVAGGLEGQSVSHYRVVRKLGQGAMGVVYEAEDATLGRPVALKFLPEELSDDARALERFEREARTVSSLNHPNICTVYEVDEHEGVRFIAMELVAGKSLDQLMAPEGLPLNEVLSYAVQIADALAKAHSAGIVHRDLKPSNIMVRQDGLVKLLDFGLAKVRPAQPAMDLTAPPPESPLSGEGAILGTLQYMAPEQLEGHEADARTDIFAFGAVIYEMATGRKAFEANSQASLIAAILEREPPPISSLRPLTAPTLERVVAICLAKKPDDRWQSARDLQRELKWVVEARDQPTARPARRPWQFLPWAAIATLLLGVAVLITSYFRQPPSATRVQFRVPLPEKVAWGQFDWPVVSPNGQRIAFAGILADGTRHLWVHSLDSAASQLVQGTENAIFPFWSPDSRFLAFFSVGKTTVELKKISVTGGPPLKLCDVPKRCCFSAGDWNKDGTILFTEGGNLHRVSAAGGDPTPVLEVDRSRHETEQVSARFLPDGRHFLYLSWIRGTAAEEARTYLGSIDSKEARMLLSPGSIVMYAPPGFLIYGQQETETLLAQPFDARTLRFTGEPFIVARQVPGDLGESASLFSVSQNGVLAYRAADSGLIQLALYSRNGQRLGSIGEPGIMYGNMAISPDAMRVALHGMDAQTRTFSIWTIELSSGITSRATFHPANDVAPVWSLDGRELVFSSDRKVRAKFNLYRKVVGSADEEQILFESNESPIFAQQYLKDGSILFTSGSNADFYVLPQTGERKPVPLLKTWFHKGAPRVSFDGHWVAYESDETGRFEIYLAAFPRFTEKHRVSNGGGRAAQWLKDGRELFYSSPGGELMSVEVKRRPRQETTTPTVFPLQGQLKIDECRVSPDGKTFTVAEPAEGVRAFTVILNWTAELKP
jgi:serine/threonine protein kinase